MKTFKVFLNHPNAKIPVKNNKTDAGFDLFSVDEETIIPGERKIIDTGIVLHLENGWEAQIRPRSGLAAKNGITIVNTPGTVDCEYRGNIKVIMLNTSTEPFIVKSGSKIAQMVIKEVPDVELEITDTLDTNTNRGVKGFGSSGV
jgi:dUTP pyrophosphatase